MLYLSGVLSLVGEAHSAALFVFQYNCYFLYCCSACASLPSEINSVVRCFYGLLEISGNCSFTYLFIYLFSDSLTLNLNCW